MWARWDLHVHTPASVFHKFGDSDPALTWERYIDALEQLPPDIVAIGVTDYLTIEGYKRLHAEKARGRLANIALILPVVELRLEKFAGARSLQKVNFHVIFSDELLPQEIDNLFLNRLIVERQLQAGRRPFRGTLSTREDLERFGQEIIDATPLENRTNESPLFVGFANATVSVKDVWSLLSQSAFHGRYLTALGVGEWDQMRWDGGGAADKRDTIERVDFVLTAAPSPAAYQQRQRMLRTAEVNDRLVDASDAHYYAESEQPNRLGETMTWIKAVPSFYGLKRAIRRFDRRVRVGEVPRKVRLWDQNKTQYISTIEIRKKQGAELEEKWFDVELPINADLVAIIGNQGGGKSALTDSMALAANVPSTDFSFLTREKFCDRAGKATAFEVCLKWADGTVVRRDLSDIAVTRGPARVQYVPQGFFDRVTNETNVLEDGQFYGEIKKAVFSHVPETERLGAVSLDEWVSKHSAAVEQRLITERDALSELNRRIAELESASSVAAIKQLESELTLQRERVAAHEEARPAPIEPPERSTEGDAVEALRVREAELLAQQNSLAQERARAVHRAVAVRNAQTELEAAAQNARNISLRIAAVLSEHGLAIEPAALLNVMANTGVLSQAAADADARVREIDETVGVDDGSGLRGVLAQTRAERALLENAMESAGRAYESYRNAEAEWVARREMLRGDADPPPLNSLRYLEQQLKHLREELPATLENLYERRREAARAILASLGHLADVYRRATEPVRSAIAAEELTRSRYRIEFDVRLQCIAFGTRFFDYVKRAGSFAGEDDGSEVLQTILSCHDVDNANEALAMVESVVEHLRWNKTKEPPKPTEPSSLLKARHSLPELYDFLFGFEYLEPAFALSLNGKPLRQLSPGERGVLLLIFYLVVDRGDMPLLIDQPEGNLNNQSIFEHLVPVFSAAKERRQVIIVTHNPNLAVVCDAEQIIYCEIDARDGNRVIYESGPLEEVRFNHLSLDLLDGTAQAFRSRHDTYADGGGL